MFGCVSRITRSKVVPDRPAPPIKMGDLSNFLQRTLIVGFFPIEASSIDKNSLFDGINMGIDKNSLFDWISIGDSHLHVKQKLNPLQILG